MYNQAILTLGSGNKDFTNTLTERGQKIRDESKKVEVHGDVLENNKKEGKR